MPTEVKISRHEFVRVDVTPAAKNSSNLVLELEPPTLIGEDTYEVRIRTGLIKRVEDLQMTVYSEADFEIRTSDHEIMKDLQHEGLIAQITHMVKTTIDQTRVWYQIATRGEESQQFQGTQIQTYFTPAELHKTVAAVLLMPNN